MFELTIDMLDCCRGCPHMDLEMLRLFADNKLIDYVPQCKYHDMCERVYKMVKGE